MPDRIIRERVTTSPELDRLSAEAERLFFRQMVRCDDYGNFEAAPEIILSLCFPRRAGTWNPVNVARWRNELTRAGLWQLYLVAGRCYGTFTTWSRHQRRRASRPKYPRITDPEAVVGSGFSARGGWPQFAANGRQMPPGSRVESRESRDVPSSNVPQPSTEPEAAPPAEDRRVDVKKLLEDVQKKLSSP